jgi:hypothetical protein
MYLTENSQVLLGGVPLAIIIGQASPAISILASNKHNKIATAFLLKQQKEGKIKCQT